ncbi:hypothetical protein [Aneurinibacillus terranovensis]|uniref:hypothetical protein n=1 Tax=Aneurinibacillus terranovensis TaxID=278991 RepID=UPI000421313F|nr:hypothetical protein [Aneurinibacillus terranovensis]
MPSEIAYDLMRFIVGMSIPMFGLGTFSVLTFCLVRKRDELLLLNEQESDF